MQGVVSFEVSVALSALGALIDAVHQVASKRTTEWHYDNVAAIAPPTVRDFAPSGDRAVAAIAVLERRDTEVGVVFAVDRDGAAARFRGLHASVERESSFADYLARCTRELLHGDGVLCRMRTLD